MKVTIEHDVAPGDYFGMNEGREKGDPAWVVSRSDLLPFLNGTPRDWIEAPPFPDTRSIRLGSLVDCMLLTPFATSETYVRQPSIYVDEKGVEKRWNGNAKVCKEWKREQLDAGKTIVAADEWADAIVMVDSIAEKRIDSWGGTVREFIAASNRQTMAVAELDFYGVKIPMRVMIDVCPKSGGFLWDLKTTGKIGSDDWGKSVSNFHYDFQAWMYTQVYNRASGETRNDFGHLCVSNSAPFLPAVRSLSRQRMEIGKRKFEAAVAAYARGIQTGEFPGYPDEVEEVGAEAWELKKWGVA